MLKNKPRRGGAFLLLKIYEMKILKFGGSSIATVERIKAVIKILKTEKSKGQFHVVFSAFGGVTDKLLETVEKASKRNKSYLKIFDEIQAKHLSYAKELRVKEKKDIKALLKELEEILKGVYLIRECSDKTSDAVTAFGELLSNTIISKALKENGVKSRFVDARLLVKTDNNYTNANIKVQKTYKNIENFFKTVRGVGVITGFLGSNDEDSTTTIGRSGSDYTASLFAAALKVDQIEIWTDVDGVMSADPRKVKESFVLDNISYEEAMELSHFGAKVLHPKTMAPAIGKNIPIVIKNTFNPTAPGTLISAKSKDSWSGVKGITSIKDIALLNLHGAGLMGIPGVANRLFKSISEINVNVILISQASSEHSICFAVKRVDADKSVKAIEKEFELEIKAKFIKKISKTNNLSVLAIVGDKMQGAKGTAGNLFYSLAKNGVNIVAIAQGSSERNISFVISEEDETIALNAIHDEFFLEQKQIHLFLVGTGLVGGTLLNQIAAQEKALRKDFGIDLQVHGIMNSRKMITSKKALKMADWDKLIYASKEKSNLKKFINQICKFKMHNSVFVDCTANEEISAHYAEILENNISIVTPNKKANSSSYKYYKKLQEAKKVNNKEFLYETNVGAGLPVISSLQDLIKSGDKVIKIEGILSGTLSYIFNSFDGNKSFSQIVKEAKEKGYTEPDPRDDLSGQDFARKLLILAREISIPLEMKDIEVENLTPKDCRKTKNIDEFLKKLAKHDKDFEQRRKKAEKTNCVLRYIGSLENGKASVKLEAVSLEHSFAALKGSDNIVSFTTQRYRHTPLIIRGPGAGPQVTAGGVFADILRLANSS